MNANIPLHVEASPILVPAASTDAVVSRHFTITAGGSKYLRLEFIVGKVVSAVGNTAGMQVSSGYNIWEATKTVAISASTEKTISAVDVSLDTLTSAAHGYTTGQPITVNSSGVLPGGIDLNKNYFAVTVDANTIKLSTTADGASLVDITSAGSGTITTTLIRSVGLRFAMDADFLQTYMPLKSQGRAVITNGAGDSVQVLAVLRLCED